MNDKSFYQDLNDEERRFFDLYKLNNPYEGKVAFAEELNTMLREKRCIDFTWQKAAKVLDSIISKHKNEFKVCLYRATLDKFLIPFIKDGIFVDLGFMSTSRKKSAIFRHYGSANKGTPALLIITCPVGTNMAPLEGNEFSDPREQEILLGREHKFKIIRECLSYDKKEIAEIVGFGKVEHTKIKIYEMELMVDKC
ncbi:ADP-ribosyltransferase [Dyadobacter frigoris]|uniref:ADP ribosyltransferase domain-containing protein n=1 Tax=Dyadobacter frigoris TaxID=2576211 RepID=A0A4U6DAF7_9BACT|nr:ADP-ribosyltransferase [Dyadobacter frigoris]TKT93836.1 hypothetical protein FDK13_01080 [Dyadobacter frigoris]GLU50948.1 hypothetical protein Dfri01_04090 [Dyadobacter frigoris]